LGNEVRQAPAGSVDEGGKEDSAPEVVINDSAEDGESDRKAQMEADNRRREEAADEEKKRREEERRKEEIAVERQKKQEEKVRREKKEQEEAAKKKRPGSKKKGLGGLSPEKKKLLKQLIMQKAAEEMKAEARRRQEEKENRLKTLVGPLNFDNIDDNGAKALCKQLHERINRLEGEKYDWEVKIRNQEFDINELTVKVNDIKGKFVKPVLKKVNKTESKLARIGKNEEKQSLAAFRGQLKSTGQNKFALEEKEEVHGGKTDWREHLKASKEGGEEGEAQPVVAES